MYDPYKALYIHLPFCKQRCIYCDFATKAVPAGSPEIAEYVEGLIGDIRQAGREGKLDEIETVYLGGGTPSFIGLDNLRALLSALSASMRLGPDVECSMEANPENLTEAMVKELWELGVNRLSLGVQSFHDEILHTLGRIHTADEAKAAIARAQTYFHNVSIDLMCGLPGQSLENFEEDVQTALSLGVTHISIYPLSIEENTPLEALVDAGVLAAPEDDSESIMMQQAARILETAGFARYEVASYAQPDFACKHNIAYWTGKPYLGFGLSAVTMTQNDDRRMRVQDGRVIDDLDRVQKCAEDLMLGMRMSEGVGDEQVFAAEVLLPALKETLQELEALGLIEHRDGRFRPTESGWLCGNELYGRIYGLAP